MSSIYLDNAATSWPKPPNVYRAMNNFARRGGGSAGRSSHRRANAAADMVDQARADLATLFGIPSERAIVFAENATAALNMAIFGLARPGTQIITSEVEHNSVRRPLAYLRDRFKCELITVPARADSRWNPEDVMRALSPRVSMVVLGWANNVTGAIQAIEPVARSCAARRFPLIVDGAQIAGAYPFDFVDMAFTLFAFTGHKGLYGPQGTGGLIVSPVVYRDIERLKFGGSGTDSDSELHPEDMPARFEAGTHNGHGIAGLGAGASWLLQHGIARVRADEMALWRYFRDGLREIPFVRVYGPDDAGDSVGIVSITVDDMQPMDVAFHLDMRRGIQVRAGLHCAPGAHRAIGTHPAGTVRFSFGAFNDAVQVDAVLETLAHIREPVPSRTRPPAPVDDEDIDELMAPVCGECGERAACYTPAGEAFRCNAHCAHDAGCQSVKREVAP